MRITLWGTRGSLASPGPDTVRYGGNTSCVGVESKSGGLLVLDAGTGIRRLGQSIRPEVRRIDLLLTHLHLDHIQGLGFFAPFFQENREVHIWGPSSTTQRLRERLQRYLSPPLFPVRLRDLPCELFMHGLVENEPFEFQDFRALPRLVSHPGATIGYRIETDGAALAYLPDHEPALGAREFPLSPQWTSGFDLMAGADMLIHDAQYTAEEYRAHVGWGHSSVDQAMAVARLAEVKRLVAFHHDPSHSDRALDHIAAGVRSADLPFEFIAGMEGETFWLGE